MAGYDVDEIQIQSLQPETVQPFWLFDGAGRKSLSDEVELLARRCRTVSPNALKHELYHERRPHSTAGTPLDRGHNSKHKKLGSRSTFQKSLNQHNLKEEGYQRVLQRFQPQKTKEFKIGPGYTISHKSNEVFAKINTDQSLDFQEYSPEQPKRDRRQSKSRGSITGDWQILEELKKKIDDLTAALEEAKVHHRIEIRELHDLHAKEIEKLNKEHEEHIKAIELDNTDELKLIEDNHKLTIQAMRNEAVKTSNELTRELKVAKAALETYKETVMKEVNSKWKENELELKLENERRTDKFLSDQKNELISEKNKELDASAKEHRRQISMIVESNKKEMDVLLRKFTASVADAERLKEIMAELEQVKAENEQMRDEMETTRKHYRAANNELHDVKVKLQTYKDHFAEKVSEVDEKYSQKINGLMLDNSNLRKQYIKKCDELFEVKSERDLKQEEDLNSAKSIMQQLILSRTRADVSLTALRDDDSDATAAQESQTNNRLKSAKSKDRPSSAPSTDKETTFAIRSSSEGYHKSSPEQRKRSTRPVSSYNRPWHLSGETGSSSSLNDTQSKSVHQMQSELEKFSFKAKPPVITLDAPSQESFSCVKIH